MRNLLHRLADLIILLLIVIVMFALGRIMLYYTNYSYFQEFTTGEIASALFSGLIYDFHITLIINAILVFFILFPINYSRFPLIISFLRIYFVVINSLALLINLMDIGFYGENGKRMIYGSFFNEIHHSLEHFKVLNIRELAVNHWFIILLWFIMLISLIYSLEFIRKRPQESPQSPLLLKITAFAAFFLIIAAYSSSLTKEQIWLEKLYSKADRKLAPLLMNNPYLLVKSAGEKYIKRETEWYFEEYDPEKRYELLDISENYTIRIVLLPFPSPDTLNHDLDKIVRDNNSLQYRTLKTKGNSLYSYTDQILFGIPNLTGGPFYKSVYSLNRINSLVQMLSKSGYHTSLYTAGLEKKTCRLIKNFYGFNSLKMLEKDEFSTGKVLTPGSGEIKKEKNFEFYIFQADESQEEYNYYKMTEHWYKDTIDKSRKDCLTIIYFIPPENQEPLAIINSSLILIAGQGHPIAIKNQAKMAQLIDIMPSILHYINYKKPFLAYGSSLFSEEDKTILTATDEDQYFILKNNLILEYNASETKALYLVGNSGFSEIDYKDSLVVEKIRLENTLQNIRNDFKQRLFHNELN